MSEDRSVPNELCNERMKNVDRRLESIEKSVDKIWGKLNSLQISLTALKTQWSLIGAVVVIVIDVAIQLYKR